MFAFIYFVFSIFLFFKRRILCQTIIIFFPFEHNYLAKILSSNSKTNYQTMRCIIYSNAFALEYIDLSKRVRGLIYSLRSIVITVNNCAFYDQCGKRFSKKFCVYRGKSSKIIGQNHSTNLMPLGRGGGLLSLSLLLSLMFSVLSLSNLICGVGLSLT